MTGLSCNVEEDVDEDGGSDEDNVHVDECDCHQPLVGAYLVKRVPVALDPEEETWLRSGWGLRPCYTWNDVSWLLDGARDRTMKLRGIAYGNTQYCALFPHDEQPNFAGDSAMGQFE